MGNITPPQISEERMRELKTQSLNAVMHGADRDEDDLLAELVAAEINRQWLERLQYQCHVDQFGFLVEGEERLQTDIALYRIKEQG